jgi:hypothetical protein
MHGYSYDLAPVLTKRFVTSAGKRYQSLTRNPGPFHAREPLHSYITTVKRKKFPGITVKRVAPPLISNIIGN